MKSVLAAVFEGHARQLIMRELPVPEPQAGEMLVKVLGCTLCGSDLHSFAGRRSVPAPTILGHGATLAVTLDALAEAVDRVTGGHGADVLLELTGSPTVFQTALPLARHGGKMMLVGSVFPTPPVPLALEQIVRRNLTVSGVHNYAPAQLLSAVRFLTATRNRFPWLQLVGKWYPLTEATAAFHAAANPASIRVGIRMG